MIIFILFLLFLLLNQANIESLSFKEDEQKNPEIESEEDAYLKEMTEKERYQNLLQVKANVFISLFQEKLILNFDNDQITRNYLFIKKLSKALNFMESEAGQKDFISLIRTNFYNKLSEIKKPSWQISPFDVSLNLSENIFDLTYKGINFSEFFIKKFIKELEEDSQEMIIRNTKIWDDFFRIISVGDKNKILQIPLEKENQKVVICIEDSASFFEDKIRALNEWKTQVTSNLTSEFEQMDPELRKIYFESYFYFYAISYFSRQGFDSYLKEIIRAYDQISSGITETPISPKSEGETQTQKDPNLLYLESFSFSHLESEYSSEWLFKMQKDIMNIGIKDWQVFMNRYKDPVSREAHLNKYMQHLFKDSFYKAPIVEEKTENSNLCYFFTFQQKTLQDFYNAFSEMINNLETSNF